MFLFALVYLMFWSESFCLFHFLARLTSSPHLPRASGPFGTLPLTVLVVHESLGVVHWPELQLQLIRAFRGQ